ncbi:MAG: ParB/RepB/Spo0J family partition protein [Clostridiales bacterium]|nr:ParB/RepB/Spo0J family partition protein [Clostridiales bacterium]
MKSSAKNIKLASVDDLFTTDESREDDARERVQEIALSELHPFKNHPFKVLDDARMMETVESVQQYGVLVPIIARPLPEGGYEIVSGHRRHRASELAGKETIPVIVRDLDDDEAVLLMVDSNLQRETILPSERAFAFKMKLEAIKHQGERSDLTSPQVGEKSSWAVNQVASEAKESKSQVQRYIRLTELIPPLLDMVDEKKVAFNPAYELSFLKPEEQQMLIETMDYEQTSPSLSQAQRLKQFSQEGRLTEDSMLAIMSEEKKPPQDRVMLTSDVLRQYFPKDYTPRKMEETIIGLLEQWKQRRLQQQKGEQQKNRKLH